MIPSATKYHFTFFFSVCSMFFQLRGQGGQVVNTTKLQDPTVVHCYQLQMYYFSDNSQSNQMECITPQYLTLDTFNPCSMRYVSKPSIASMLDVSFQRIPVLLPVSPKVAENVTHFGLTFMSYGASARLYLSTRCLMYFLEGYPVLFLIRFIVSKIRYFQPINAPSVIHWVQNLTKVS